MESPQIYFYSYFKRLLVMSLKKLLWAKNTAKAANFYDAVI